MNLYTSRSAIETYACECQFRHYLRYKYPLPDGTPAGIQKKFKSIDLLFGTAFHNGVSALLNGWEFDKALDMASTAFARDMVEQNVKDLLLTDEPVLQEFSQTEHTWLLEALLSLWDLTEGARIREEFQVVIVEKEIDNFFTKIRLKDDHERLELAPLFLSSRVDALLFHKESHEYQTLSIKTTKLDSIFTDNMVNRDLQGHLEIWAVEQWLEKVGTLRRETTHYAKEILGDSISATLGNFLNKKIPDVDKVGSVRFGLAVKGDRKPDEGLEAHYKDMGLEGYPFRKNPYLYGWRKQIEDGTYNYAHSWLFNTDKNVSGKGALGKTWQKFSVSADYSGGIRQWITDINNGKLQPEADNPIQDFIVVKESRRDPDGILKAVHYAQQVEAEAWSKEPEQFIPNTKSCVLGEKYTCEFLEICPYSGRELTEISRDPVGSGLYQIRKPHHETEEKQLIERLKTQ